jgi:hypothetical protein
MPNLSVLKHKGTRKMRSIMSSWSWKAGLAGAAIVAASAYALAQMPDHAQMHERMMSSQMPQGMQGVHGQIGSRGMMMGTGMTGRPSVAGQDAFGTIQEVVQILEGDPTTDWSKVNIAALREHLIDMDEVTLRAVATEHALDNGVEIAVIGDGRTLEAIKRMVPAHAGELKKIGWNANTEELPNGVKLVVTTTDAKQAIKLKAFGFMGLMVQGGHHQLHHLMMAKGELHVH